MTNLYWILIILIALILIFILNLYLTDDSCKGEVKSPTKALTLKPNWMKKYGSKRLNEIYMPATHDSSAYQVALPESITNYKGLLARFVSHFTMTQKYTVYDQLRHGIRSLDLRVNTAASEPWLSHTAFTAKLEDVFKEVRQFLDENPSEIVIVLLKEDYEFRLYGTKWEVIAPLIDKYFKDIAISEDSKTRTLSELTTLRKQVVIVNKNNAEIKCDTALWSGNYIDYKWYNSGSVETVIEKLQDDISNISAGKFLNMSGPIVTPDLSNDIIAALNPLSRGCKWTSLEAIANVANDMYLKMPIRRGNYKIRFFDYYNEDVIQDTINQNNT